MPSVPGPNACAPGALGSPKIRAKRGVAAGRSAQRGTSGATTGGGGRSAPDPDYVPLLLLRAAGSPDPYVRLLLPTVSSSEYRATSARGPKASLIGMSRSLGETKPSIRP